MLYKLNMTDGKFDGLAPIAFEDFASFGHLEKDLEDLIAQNISGVLFEDAGLMPIYQQQQGEEVGDVYALNAAGDLNIFELKRSTAGEGAVHQALRYAQDAGQWSHAQLQKRFRQYSGRTTELVEAHREAFDLDLPVEAGEFNRRQRLTVIGSAADDSLISAVDYWRTRGVNIDFLPYRIYELAGEHYFEFFALPYDRHRNPADKKGILFDTNRSYNEESIWYMMEGSRVAAFGDAKRFVERINDGDIVFFSHRWEGVVAAARVQRGQIREDRVDGTDTLYRTVKFITPIPRRGEELRAMPFAMVKEITEMNFYWASTIKVPYLPMPTAEALAIELRQHLEEEV